MSSSTLITMAIGSGSVSRKYPQDLQARYLFIVNAYIVPRRGLTAVGPMVPYPAAEFLFLRTFCLWRMRTWSFCESALIFINRQYQNAKQPGHCSESRIAQSSESKVRDSARCMARVRSSSAFFFFIFFFYLTLKILNLKKHTQQMQCKYK